MQWRIEIRNLGKKDGEQISVQIAPSWHAALMQARAARGETSDIGGCSIELLPAGYRAIDPTLRVTYVIRPDGVAEGAVVPAGASAGAAPKPEAAKPEAAKPEAVKPEAVKPEAGAASDSAAKVKIPRPAASERMLGGNGALATAKATALGALLANQPIAEIDAHLIEPTPLMLAPVAPVAKAPVVAAPVVAAPVVAAPVVAAPVVAAPVVAVPIVAVPIVVTYQPDPKVLAQIAKLTPDSIVLLSQRVQDASGGTPLTYREFAYALPMGTDEAVAEAFARNMLADVQRTLPTHARIFVTIAVFDEIFTGRPTVSPLVVLEWKDWKGAAPTIQRPRLAPMQSMSQVPPRGSMAPQLDPLLPPLPPPPKAANAGAPLPVDLLANDLFLGPATAPPRGNSVPPADAAARTSVQPPSAQSASASAAPNPLSGKTTLMAATQPSALGAYVAQIDKAPAVRIEAAADPFAAPGNAVGDASAANPRGISVFPVSGGGQAANLLAGDELIGALFEDMAELHFQPDAVDAAYFCLHIARTRLAATRGMVHFFDLDRREFLLAAAMGQNSASMLLRRTPTSEELLGPSTSARHALVYDGARAAERHKTLGGVSSILIAPVRPAGRFMGAVELGRGPDAAKFREDDANALWYIVEQYSEFINTKGVVFDSARILRGARPTR